MIHAQSLAVELGIPIGGLSDVQAAILHHEDLMNPHVFGHMTAWFAFDLSGDLIVRGPSIALTITRLVEWLDSDEDEPGTPAIALEMRFDEDEGVLLIDLVTRDGQMTTKIVSSRSPQIQVILRSTR